MWLNNLYMCGLILFSLKFDVALSYSDLRLLPDDPLVEEGGDLILNCTIEQIYRGPYNYTSIFFFGNKREYRNGSNIEFVAPHSAVLTLHNITVHDAGHFTCCLPDRPVHTGMFAAQNVVVIRRPMVPVVTGCIVNNWHSMTCTWLPTYQQQISYTLAKEVEYHLKWRQQSLTSVWHDCPHYSSEESCEWSFEDHQETTDEHLADEEIYCVQVIAVNQLKIDVISTEYCFQPSHIVMLNPVHVTASSVNASHAVVSWTLDSITADHADTFRVFNVSVVSPWQSEIVYIEVIYKLSTTLEVIPFTNYTVSVKVRPSFSTLWSSPATVMFQSQSTAPLASPETHPSAFRILQIGLSTRRVMLYWKSLPVREHQGPRLHYMLTIRDETSPQASISVIVPGNLSSTEVEINNSVVHGTILSCNNIGCASPRTVIRFPVSSSSVTSNPSPGFIVEGSNQSVTLHWQKNDDDLNCQYTVFWCPMQSVFGSCHGDINWQDILPESDHYNLSVREDYTTYMFGLATSINSETTGIQWAHPLYSLTGLANPPTDVKAGIPSDGAFGELLVTWTHPLFTVRQGYIQSFDLFYCELNGSKHCTNDPSRESVPGSAQSHLVTSLKHGAFYKLWMFSVTRAGSSIHSSTNVLVQTAESPLTPAIILGVVVGLLVVVIMSSIVIFAGFRYCQRLNRKFSSGIAVRVPPAGNHSNSQSFMMNNLNSAPVIEYSRIVYSRQGSRLSNSSRDSGHFGVACSPSVSPQNGTSDNLRPVHCVNNRGDSCSNCSSPTTRTGFEACGVMYINNDIQSSQQYQLLSSGYDRLVVQSTSPDKCTTDLEDGQTKGPEPSPPVIHCSSSSSDNVTDNTLTVGLLDVNRDSGYVQHDEWLSKLGIGSLSTHK